MEVNCKGDIKLGTACLKCPRCLRNSKKQNIETEDILRMSYRKISEIPGVKIHDMYYCGWECDTTLWELPDGRLFGTDHGKIKQLTSEEFNEYRTELQEYIKSIEDIK